ncbi:MAG: 3-isopropylmalate dehydrogenase [Hydrogenibacillus sp.]|nr:3-isopropylmalate dehydrogenase [Hydrogenibacillus sp.]MBE3596327.1 3-isopropylmalate dehydrogenase [Hydrogenibacillus sp.]
MKRTIALLAGDGIGPEVAEVARRLITALSDVAGIRLNVEDHPIGGAAIDAHGEPLPKATLQAALAADAVLLGAVGGPKWDALPPERRPEAGLLALRKALDVYANVRPVRSVPALGNLGPLFAAEPIDLVIIRELTGGLYFGRPRGISGGVGARQAIDTLVYTEAEIERIVRLAFKMAEQRSGRLTSVDKANVLTSSRLWRDVVERVQADHPSVTVRHVLVDAMAMELVQKPWVHDVIVTENMFGDILSDLGGALVGSLGLLPSASLGERGPHLYEPVHGSAPDIAGRDAANPTGMILSTAMMFEHSFAMPDVARAIAGALDDTFADGFRTADLVRPKASAAEDGGDALRVVGTQAFGDAVIERAVARLKARGVYA